MVVAPLALSVVQLRYPHLFHQYRLLSDREIETQTILEQPIDDATIDGATGLRTTIFFQDFTAPLSTAGEDAGCPMTANSTANKFCIFIWKALCACESGSCGGDACRQYGILEAAYNDLSSFDKIPVNVCFEHLLGWTCAVVNHQIHLVMERYDSTQIRALFVNVASLWKKIFEEIPVEGGMGVSAELRAFAIGTGETLQKLLRAYKKQFKDNFDGVTLSFNFIRKPRAKKAAVATMMTTKYNYHPCYYCPQWNECHNYYYYRQCQCCICYTCHTPSSVNVANVTPTAEGLVCHVKWRNDDNHDYCRTPLDGCSIWTYHNSTWRVCHPSQSN